MSPVQLDDKAIGSMRSMDWIMFYSYIKGARIYEGCRAYV